MWLGQSHKNLMEKKAFPTCVETCGPPPETSTGNTLPGQGGVEAGVGEDVLLSAGGGVFLGWGD